MTAPETFGRFQIDRKLGSGAMGVVYLATDPVLDRKVAVKAIQVHPGLADKQVEELKQRFMNEARSAANLSHPNVVTVYEAGFEDDSLYIAMEYVAGESLEDVIASERTLSYKEVSDLALQLGSALDHAHRNGVVHRDIKPGNVLIDPRGKPKVADFGVARQATSTLTATGTIIGTPAYMSPEQITGHPVTGASDQFSLAVVLYEMLTGRKPFTGEGATTVLYRIVHEQPASMLQQRKNLPPALETAVMKALAKSPEERYGSCTEFAEAIRGALKAAPIGVETAVASEIETSLGVSSGDATGPAPSPRSAAPAAAADESPLRPWLGPALLAGGALVILIAGALWLSGDDTLEPAPVEIEEPAAVEAESGESEEPGPAVETYRIETRPTGARVTLDGRAIEGGTPVSVAIDPTVRHTILLEMPGREAISWAFVPEELPASQQDTKRLFFPLREAGSAVAADAPPDPAAGGAGEAAEADLEPIDPIEIRGRDIERPVVVERLEPEFPEWAADEGLQDYVVLQVVVDKTGRVRSGRPLTSVHPELERLALEAARQWRLEPATRRGEPVDVFFNLTIQFRTEGEDGPG